MFKSRGCLVLSLLLTMPWPGWARNSSASTEHGLRITIRLYDYAHVPSGILARAQKQAEWIFAFTGVETIWLHCAITEAESSEKTGCESTPGPADLLFRILPRSMAPQTDLPPNSFGFAYSLEEGRFGRIANAFYGRVDELAREHGYSRATTLGYVVAHEIGHLLLGRGSHARTGIMRCPWSAEELKAVTAGTLLFNPKQARQIRGQVMERMRDSLARR